jgi:hypothetical protein
MYFMFNRMVTFALVARLKPSQQTPLRASASLQATTIPNVALESLGKNTPHLYATYWYFMLLRSASPMV